MPARDIIVVAASAGGVEALQSLARTLPSDFPASIFVTLHFPQHGFSVLPRILSRAGAIPAVHAADGESIVGGRIYVAPPDNHLLLTPTRLRLVRGPKENGNRPAADPMFRSAAVAFGPRVIGVVLTGNLDDGTAGLAAVKRGGGLALVEDPETALFPSMPRSALDNVRVDRVAPIRHVARVLLEMIDEPIPVDVLVSRRDLEETALAAGNLEAMSHAEARHPGTVSSFSCPDCGGVLWELHDDRFVRYRCRVGHAWTGATLLGEQQRKLEEALWVALRSLEESASLARQIAARQRSRGADTLASRFEAQAESVETRAGVVRAVLESASEGERTTLAGEDAGAVRDSAD